MYGKFEVRFSFSIRQRIDHFNAHKATHPLAANMNIVGGLYIVKPLILCKLGADAVAVHEIRSVGNVDAVRLDGQRRRIGLQLDAGKQIRHDFGQTGGQHTGDFLQNEIANLPLVLNQPIHREQPPTYTFHGVLVQKLLAEQHFIDVSAVVPVRPRLKSVSFHYAADTNVIHGVSFETPAGALTALVGPSGSGKSTLLRLMARFWDYQHGQVRFAGKELRSIAPESLLSQVSMVMQNAYLFRGTIRENLCFGNERITEQQMLDACRKARCHDFISALPESYDTVVGEGGATLSGGERQRISLARAFLKDVPILLLDEPTASLDADNEAAVQKALDEISKERTVIMIAHRLKTVRGAQQILVLENGRITQKGTHNQLVGTDGLYSRLWELQNQAGNYTFKQS